LRQINKAMGSADDLPVKKERFELLELAEKFSGEISKRRGAGAEALGLAPGLRLTRQSLGVADFLRSRR
jgi:hypothetical protein